MASADLRDEVNCFICLNIYTDPVMLGCGHNFCRGCIDRVLDTQKWCGVYSCPECRDEFTERPELLRNITLCNLAQKFLSTGRKPEELGFICTYCLDSPVPACKFCLHCEAFLCDKHLRVHSKSPEHVLTDPGTSLERRKCLVHKKILKYYCTTDGVCVCVSCSLAKEHQGHQVETLGEACEKKKATLRNALQQTIKGRNEAEAQVLGFQKHRNNVQEKAKAINEKATDLLKKKLEELENSIRGEIYGQEAKILSLISDHVKKLEDEKEEMTIKIQTMEELCNLDDPLTLLQESGNLNLHKVSSEASQGPSDDLTLAGNFNLDVNKTHLALHNSLDNAVAEIKWAFPVTVTPVGLGFGQNRFTFGQNMIKSVFPTKLL